MDRASTHQRAPTTRCTGWRFPRSAFWMGSGRRVVSNVGPATNPKRPQSRAAAPLRQGIATPPGARSNRGGDAPGSGGRCARAAGGPRGGVAVAGRTPPPPTEAPSAPSRAAAIALSRGTATQTFSILTSPEARDAPMTARDRLCFGPWRPAPQPDPGRRAGGPPGDLGPTLERGRRPHVRRRQIAPVAPAQFRGPTTAAPRAWRAQAEAAPQWARAWSSSQESTVVRARQRLDWGALGGTGVLQLVDDQMREASRNGLPQIGPLDVRQLKHCVGVHPSRRRRAISRRAARRPRRTRAPGLPSQALRLALARLLLRPASEPLRPSTPDDLSASSGR